MDKEKKEVFDSLQDTLNKLLSHKKEIDPQIIDISSHFEIEMIAKTTENLVDQIQKLQTTIYRKQSLTQADSTPKKRSKIRPHRLKRKR